MPQEDSERVDARTIMNSANSNDPWTAVLQAIAGEPVADVIDIDENDGLMVCEEHADG
jgi:hypothetical protein